MKEDKPSFLEKWLRKKIAISRKRLGYMALMFLGAGALITIVSLEAGAFLIALMIFLLVATILWEIWR